jgi:predicted RNA-binding protein with PUA-like domain
MRAMQPGDGVLYYHSSANPPCVVGTAVVARAAYPDHTALDPKDDHYDPKASRANPIWEMVDIRLEKIFARPVPIGELRSIKELAAMELLRTGSRLSVQPVRPREFELVCRLGATPAAAEAKAKPARKTSRATTPRKKKARAS